MARAGMRLIRLGIQDLSYAGVGCTWNELGPKCSCRTIVSVRHPLTHSALTANQRGHLTVLLLRYCHGNLRIYVWHTR